jgi:hypothetical protein
MEITINLKTLKEHKLTLSEYVYLIGLYENKSDEEMREIISCVDILEEDSLQDKGYIKIMPNGKTILRNAGKKLFESGDLFTRFLVMFPVKTPDGRVLSPAGADTIKGRTLRDKWKRHFKNKPDKERRALEVLDAELEWRRANNNLKFMHNAETWLNQGDYETYEYLLEERKNNSNKAHNEFM